MAGVIFSASRSFCKYGQGAARRLAEAGWSIRYDDWPPKAARIEDVVDLVVSTQKVDAESIGAAVNLRRIAKYGTGVDNIDLDAVRRRGIALFTAAGANTEAVAEMALALMLAVGRGVSAADASIRKGGWARSVGVELAGKKVGLVGMGAIGRCLIKRLRGFEPVVSATDPEWDEEFAKAHSVARSDVDAIFSGSDFVSLHCPLTPKTFHLAGEKRIGMMKPTAYLINTSRGAVVDEQALFDALSDNRIAGAALDVFENEPLVGSPLAGLDNVVLTSHMGAYTYEAFIRMDEAVAKVFLD